MVEILLLVVGGLLVIAGVAGCMLPFLPGPPLSYLGLVLLQTSSRHPFTANFLVVYGIITLMVLMLDFIIPVYSTKKFHGSKYGVRGSIIGLIAGFINGILDDPATKNTTIILVSDHLHAKPPERLSKIARSKRDYMFVSFNAHVEANFHEDLTRDSTALDVAPTLLALLGYDISTFNLGRNLFKKENTLVESLGRERLFANIAIVRAKIREQWNESKGLHN